MLFETKKQAICQVSLRQNLQSTLKNCIQQINCDSALTQIENRPNMHTFRAYWKTDREIGTNYVKTKTKTKTKQLQNCFD